LIFFRYGADMNKKDHWGRSPIEDASRLGHKELIKSLDKAFRLKGKVHLERFNSFTLNLMQ